MWNGCCERAEVSAGIVDSVGCLSRGFTFWRNWELLGENEMKSTERVLEEWEEGVAHSGAQKGERGQGSGIGGGRQIQVKRQKT